METQKLNLTNDEKLILNSINSNFEGRITDLCITSGFDEKKTYRILRKLNKNGYLSMQRKSVYTITSNYKVEGINSPVVEVDTIKKTLITNTIEETRKKLYAEIDKSLSKITDIMSFEPKNTNYNEDAITEGGGGNYNEDTIFYPEPYYDEEENTIEDCNQNDPSLKHQTPQAPQPYTEEPKQATPSETITKEEDDKPITMEELDKILGFDKEEVSREEEIKEAVQNLKYAASEYQPLIQENTETITTYTEPEPFFIEEETEEEETSPVETLGESVEKIKKVINTSITEEERDKYLNELQKLTIDYLNIKNDCESAQEYQDRIDSPEIIDVIDAIVEKVRFHIKDKNSMIVLEEANSLLLKLDLGYSCRDFQEKLEKHFFSKMRMTTNTRDCIIAYAKGRAFIENTIEAVRQHIISFDKCPIKEESIKSMDKFFKKYLKNYETYYRDKMITEFNYVFSDKKAS